MRARNVKPGFFKNEQLGTVTAEARLLFIGLWCLADREGRLEDRPMRIKCEVFPFDAVDCEPLLESLADQKLIVRYVSHTNKPCIQVVNFLAHQCPHWTEKPSELPAPKGVKLPRKTPRTPQEDSGSAPRENQERSPLDHKIMNHKIMNHKIMDHESTPPKEEPPTQGNTTKRRRSRDGAKREKSKPAAADAETDGGGGDAQPEQKPGWRARLEAAEKEWTPEMGERGDTVVAEVQQLDAEHRAGGVPGEAKPEPLTPEEAAIRLGGNSLAMVRRAFGEFGAEWVARAVWGILRLKPAVKNPPGLFHTWCKGERETRQARTPKIDRPERYAAPTNGGNGIGDALAAQVSRAQVDGVAQEDSGAELPPGVVAF